MFWYAKTTSKEREEKSPKNIKNVTAKIFIKVKSGKACYHLIDFWENKNVLCLFWYSFV